MAAQNINLCVKHLLDKVVSFVLLVALSPLLLFIALAIKIEDGGPVFFRQARPGEDGKAFDLVKFRTMRAAYDEHGDSLPDAQRLTPFGRFLRRSSLDELPELWNVLTGDMSLVGPRPLLMEYLPLYTPEQARRHEVKPGITGWAQINGRNAISWEQKFDLDVWYVDNRSMRLDMRVLFTTFGKLFHGEDINQPGHATMPKFRGPENG